MNRIIIATVLSGLLLAVVYGQGTNNRDLSKRTLLFNYLRYKVAQNAMSQAMNLAEDEGKVVQKEVREVSADWLTARNKRIRADLEAELGENAADNFKTFWVEFEQAEADNDKDYLANLAAASGVSNASSYAKLRKAMLEGALASDVEAGSFLLTAVQRWIEAVDDNKLETGTLPEWLRGEIEIKTEPVDPLEAAEAEAEPYVADPKAKTVSPLDSFVSARKAKRKKALEDAKAGMQQVATERKDAEAKYAARVKAAAEADAANIKRYADRLSSAQKEAFEQRKNSFGNRLKNVVSATVGAATGAFTGGLGAKAGEAAVDAIWGQTSPARVHPLPQNQQPATTP